MNAEEHLKSLGWAGPGNALNSHLKGHKGRGGLGLTKPILVSQKKNTFGIGKKAHEPPSGTEWWLKGFEKALKGVDTDGGKSAGASAATSGTSTPLGDTSGYVGKHKGLYTFFIKGEQMKGTLEEDIHLQLPSDKIEEATSKKEKKSSSKKRKSEVLDEEDTSTNHNDPTTSVKRSRKTKGTDTSPTTEFTQVGSFLELRDKDSKKRRKDTERNTPTEAFQQISNFMVERDQVDPTLKKRHKKNKRKEEEDSDSSTERRRQRKEEKRLRKQQQQITAVSPADPSASPSKWSSLVKVISHAPDEEFEQEDTIPAIGPSSSEKEKEEKRRAKALRKLYKEEKKRLKEEKEKRLKNPATTNGSGLDDIDNVEDLEDDTIATPDDTTVCALLAWDKAVKPKKNKAKA